MPIITIDSALRWLAGYHPFMCLLLTSYPIQTTQQIYQSHASMQMRMCVGLPEQDWFIYDCHNNCTRRTPLNVMSLAAAVLAGDVTSEISKSMNSGWWGSECRREGYTTMRILYCLPPTPLADIHPGVLSACVCAEYSMMSHNNWIISVWIRCTYSWI